MVSYKSWGKPVLGRKVVEWFVLSLVSVCPELTAMNLILHAAAYVVKISGLACIKKWRLNRVKSCTYLKFSITKAQTVTLK
jgi:hypothetical protein